jgi:phage/plasmid primase-like uncharacterized protein
MSKLKDKYEIRLRCATCGCEDHFESNEDRSYIKCTFCNREYFGGLEELKESNQETIDEIKEEIKADATDYLKERLKKAFKGNKYIKFR